MTRTPLLMTLGIAALLVAPLAGAKWMAFGTYEPDTTYDTSKYMTQDDPGTSKNSTVYFNAYTKNGCAIQGNLIALGTGWTGCAINPNAGALETNLDLPTNPLVAETTFQVMMGVWTDCNGDGYVGLAETAALEYHARVLTTPLSSVGTSVCQPVQPPACGGGVPASECGVGAGAFAKAGMPNNYANWVTEFISIGGVDYDGGDSRVFFDIDAMVWAEPGVPDAPVNPPVAAGAGCVAALPRRGNGNEEWGEAHSTGALVWALDCRGQRSFTDEPPGPVGPTSPISFSVVQTFNTAAGSTGLGFGNDPRNSTSPLNRELGSENAQNGGVIVKAQDCGSGRYGPGDNSPGEEPETLNTRNTPISTIPQLAEFNDLTLLRPVPANPVNTNPSTWSVPATINYTLESAPETNGQETGDGPDDDRDCNFENDEGKDFYGGNYGNLDTFGAIPALEANPQVAPAPGKVGAAVNLRFQTASRGTVPGTAIAGGPGGSDSNLGVPAVSWTQSASNGHISEWVGGGNWLNPSVFRFDLGAPENSGLPRAPYVTFYGFVGSSIKSRPWTMPNAAEKYGDGPNSCNGQTTGTRLGWNCDASQWYINSEGQPATVAPSWCPERPCAGFGQADISIPLARVHQEFTFRDTDCIDGRVGQTGVGVLPAYFGGPCERPAS